MAKRGKERHSSEKVSEFIDKSEERITQIVLEYQKQCSPLNAYITAAGVTASLLFEKFGRANAVLHQNQYIKQVKTKLEELVKSGQLEKVVIASDSNYALSQDSNSNRVGYGVKRIIETV